MRVVPILTAPIALLGLAVGLAACGGGGGPADLSLGGPTSAPVVTTAPSTSTTTGAAQPAVDRVARARFAELAVYAAPNAAQPIRVLKNPWAPKGAPLTRIPQVLLVATSRSDGWVQVALPDTAQPTTGWVRQFDVKITRVMTRLRIVLAQRRLTVLDHGRVISRSPITLTGAALRPGQFFVHRVITSPGPSAAVSAYVFRLPAALATRVPLGAPVEITG